MTKYILNSGGLKTRNDKGRLFFEEIIKELGDKPNVLMCFFAEKREDWESKFSNYRTLFQSAITTGQKIDFELAFPKTFIDQINRCDAIYIHGGDDFLLQFWLKGFNLPEIWEGKNVATNSASSSVLSVASWTCDWRECMEGLGILPIKFIPHFGSLSYGADDPRGPIDWAKAKEELEDFGDKSLPIYALPEGEFVVFER